MIENKASHDIFISYRHSDRYVAMLTAFYLSEKGYDVWWDAELNVEWTDDNEYPEVIDCYIRNCLDFVLLVTENTFDEERISDPDDWIRREIKCALENNKRILPFRIGDTGIPKSLPDDIDMLMKKHFFPYPIDPYNKTSEEIDRIWEKQLKSSPSFKGTSTRTPGNTYDPEKKEERIRNDIQAKNTSRFDMQIINTIVEKMNRDGLIVLDVGCGNGTVGKDRFKDPRFSKVVGIDKSKTILDEAQSRTLTREDKRKFKYFNVDVESENFIKEMNKIKDDLDIDNFDIVFMSQVLHFYSYKKPLNWLLELSKLLNPHGYIIVRESDDGNKMSYGTNGEETYLMRILEMTEALNLVADRKMGRQLCNLMKQADFSNVKIYNFMRDTSAMSSQEERLNLYNESFSWRLDAVKEENAPGSVTVQEMDYNLKQLKTCFEKNPNDFWYCEQDYICVGMKKSEKE